MTVRTTLGTPVEDQIVVEVDGVATDPASISLRYRRFDDPLTEVEVDVADPLAPTAPVERLGIGTYRALIDLPSAGDWRIRWETTDPKGSSEAKVIVRSDYPSA